jgi:tRNA threonylcarbamoyladenosine biosynthesis protein TsaB
MLILNIETATPVCSVSLAENGKTIALQERNEANIHGSVHTIFVQDVLKQAGKTLQDIDAFAVSMGPGSYTGLRIGVSTVKGFCYALNKPLIGINTLQSLSYGFVQDNKIEAIDAKSVLYCPMIDARRMEVYTAFFDAECNFVKQTSADIIDENAYAELFKTNTLVFFGDGAAKCKDALQHNASAIFIEDVFPSANNMSLLSYKAYSQNKFEDIAYFEPFYLKDFLITTKKQSAE